MIPDSQKVENEGAKNTGL